jgi:hypothetical protein
MLAHWSKELQIGLLNLMVLKFSALWPIQGCKDQRWLPLCIFRTLPGLNVSVIGNSAIYLSRICIVFHIFSVFGLYQYRESERKISAVLYIAEGSIPVHKVQQFISTWGTLKSFFFSISALTPNVKPVGADFNFCTNRNAGFGFAHWPWLLT